MNVAPLPEGASGSDELNGLIARTRLQLVRFTGVRACRCAGPWCANTWSSSQEPSHAQGSRAKRSRRRTPPPALSPSCYPYSLAFRAVAPYPRSRASSASTATGLSGPLTGRRWMMNRVPCWYRGAHRQRQDRKDRRGRLGFRESASRSARLADLVPPCCPSGLCIPYNMPSATFVLRSVVVLPPAIGGLAPL